MRWKKPILKLCPEDCKDFTQTLDLLPFSTVYGNCKKYQQITQHITLLKVYSFNAVEY
jgi:hypothetical protein